MRLLGSLVSHHWFTLGPAVDGSVTAAEGDRRRGQCKASYEANVVYRMDVSHARPLKGQDCPDTVPERMG